MPKELGFYGVDREGTPAVFAMGPDYHLQTFLEELRQYLNQEFTIFDEETDQEESFNVSQQVLESVCDVIKKIHFMLIQQNISLKWPKVNPLSENELDIHWYDDIADILLNVEDDYFYYSAKLKKVVNDKRKRRKGGEDQSEAIAGITSFCREYYPKIVSSTWVSMPNLGVELSTFAVMTETPSSSVVGLYNAGIVSTLYNMYDSRADPYTSSRDRNFRRAGSNYITRGVPYTEIDDELEIVDD